MKTVKEWARAVVCVGVGAAGLAIAPRAQAKKLSGALELQLKTTVFEYQLSKTWTTPSSSTPGAVQPALTPTSTASTSFGLQSGGYGATVGYFISEHIELGAGLLLVHGHSGESAQSQNSTWVAIQPRFEYAFGAGRVRPYLVGLVGYGHSWETSSGSSFESEAEGHGFTFGGGVGAHVFLGDSWSIEPEFLVLRALQSGTRSVSAAYDTGFASYAYDDTRRATSAVLAIGLSGWVGGE